eukprot:m.246132 g.246132  ORF g.246132 m.246132 type:complete len:157 (-) comp19487_c0_seq13:1197-1667(-)
MSLSFVPYYLPITGTFDVFTYWSELNEYIDLHNASDPFFLYLSMHMVHAPLESPQRFKNMYPTGLYCDKRLTIQAMVSVVDELIANLTTKLKAQKLWNDTVFVFASDNGGDPYVGANAPFKGGKATLFEGIRASVPKVFFRRHVIDDVLHVCAVCS